jgi:hypothetical protein
VNIVLWILQVLLALAFLAHGWLFLAPPPEIAAKMNEAPRTPAASPRRVDNEPLTFSVRSAS